MTNEYMTDEDKELLMRFACAALTGLSSGTNCKYTVDTCKYTVPAAFDIAAEMLAEYKKRIAQK